MVSKLLAIATVCSLAAHADPVQEPAATPPVKFAEEKPTPPKKGEKPKSDKSDLSQKKIQTAIERKPISKEQRKANLLKKKPDPAKKDKKTAPSKKNPKAKHSRPHKGHMTEAQIEEAKKQQEQLAILNALAAEKQKRDTLGIRTQIAKLKLDRELLTEKLAFAAAEHKAKHADSFAKYEAEKNRLTREATLAKLEADRLANNLKVLQTNSSLKTSELMAEISEIETTNKRENYANAKPQYLDNPLKKDGTLVISDRRIPFNGAVTSTLADRVTTRINYFNNKDPKKPIFIVIDSSPGGSVMAGYRILKAMEGSEAPVYVVVKSFAASMAASVTTLAERSFVYPNAIILHHQLSQTFGFSSMNLTDQKENYEEMKRWWERLAGPISEKMGITSDEFIEMMYQKTVSGDWTEFGDDAVKLKWADHVVTRIHETALLKNPDAKRAAPTTTRSASIENGLTPAIDSNGTPYMILPRRNPKDVYFMHNPDGFYRFK